MDNQESRFKNLPKIIFLILGTIILVELFIGVSSLMKSPTNTNLPSETVLPLSLGKFNFELESNQAQVGDEFLVNLVMDTGGYTIASASVAVRFDPEYFEGTSSGYINVNKNYGDGFNGVVNLENLRLTPKKAGNTMIETSLGQMDEYGSGKDVFSSQYSKQEINIR